MVHNDELIVLDGTRIHILDLQGKFLKEFQISSSGELAKGPAPGLFMDAENRIYVSDPRTGIIRMYDHDGRLPARVRAARHQARGIQCTGRHVG